MGQDKATLKVAGRPLIAHMIGKLTALGYAPEIAGSRPDLLPFAPVLGDLHPGCGPLAGIEAALASTTHELNLFVPVDLPLLPAELLAVLLDRAARTGALATVPSAGGQPQPLCAVYHRSLLSAMREGLDEGDYKVMRAIRAATGEGELDIFALETLRVAADFTWLPATPESIFLNCNTPEDLREVEEKMEDEQDASRAWNTSGHSVRIECSAP